MTRAEEKAVEYQVKTHGPNVMGGASILSEDEYMRLNMNYDFKAGYEEGEKDLILRTKRWIAEIHRICDITDEHGYSIELRDLIASFEKSMKEENG